MGRAAAISRGLLSDQVKDRLLEAILAGRYAPGSRIVETRVASALGVSQAPVREALRDLEALGLVELTQFRGARVRRPSKTELLEGFVVRAELESLGVRLAVPHLGTDDLEELRRLLAEMRRAAEANEPRREARADAAFHARLVELAGSAVLARLWRTLEPAARTTITLHVPGLDARRIAELHGPIVDALEDGDSQAAEAAVRRHFRDAEAEFDALFVDGPEPAAAATRAAGHPPSGKRVTATTRAA